MITSMTGLKLTTAKTIKKTAGWRFFSLCSFHLQGDRKAQYYLIWPGIQAADIYIIIDQELRLVIGEATLVSDIDTYFIQI